jgi:glycosyltransferase involved in cell wall biosynthesis
MAKRTILAVHNFYQQRGGEDEVFEAQVALLERRGHNVIRYQDHNDRISTGAVAGIAGIWNHRSYSRIRRIISQTRPDVAHFHNTFPLVSPAAYYAARRLSVPVVQKLANFRLICPGAYLLRNGNICEDCVKQNSLLPALKHRCYRSSRLATAAVCATLATHRALGTWSRAVDIYIAATEFTRRKFTEAGFPAERIVIGHHAIYEDPGVGNGRGGYALFVGRLSPEKGIDTLAAAWRSLSDIPLKVAGDGPLAGTAWPVNVLPLGYQSRENVQALMRDATVVIVPSIWYEFVPLTILEAFACGTPVIVSDIGSMAERVDHHRTGLRFRPRDPEDLARQVRWAFNNPERMQEMRTAARREFETKYTAEVNYKRLIEIYETAIDGARRRKRDRQVEGAAAVG